MYIVFCLSATFLSDNRYDVLVMALVSFQPIVLLLSKASGDFPNVEMDRILEFGHLVLLNYRISRPECRISEQLSYPREYLSHLAVPFLLTIGPLLSVRLSKFALRGFVDGILEETDRAVRVIVTVFMISLINIVEASYRWLWCIPLEGVRRLRVDPDLQCDSTTYQNYLGVSITVVCVAIVLPVVFLMHLRRHRQHLRGSGFERRWGYLYSGVYTDSYGYHCIDMWIMICVVVGVSILEGYILAVTATVFFGALCVLEASARPRLSKVEHILRLLSLTTTVVSAILVLLATEDVGPVSELSLTVIFLCETILVLYTMYFVINAMSNAAVGRYVPFLIAFKRVLRAPESRVIPQVVKRCSSVMTRVWALLPKKYQDVDDPVVKSSPIANPREASSSGPGENAQEARVMKMLESRVEQLTGGFVLLSVVMPLVLAKSTFYGCIVVGSVILLVYLVLVVVFWMIRWRAQLRAALQQTSCEPPSETHSASNDLTGHGSVACDDTESVGVWDPLDSPHVPEVMTASVTMGNRGTRAHQKSIDHGVRIRDQLPHSSTIFDSAYC
eukprot:GFYU01003115.1.p1 GENE.GFYU01003115.1~~GFYU01003115.1.p1  ORF type:complete len:631 (-),score=67.02 GFYU01003115.1:687-2363(-)